MRRTAEPAAAAPVPPPAPPHHTPPHAVKSARGLQDMASTGEAEGGLNGGAGAGAAGGGHDARAGRGGAGATAGAQAAAAPTTSAAGTGRPSTGSDGAPASGAAGNGKLQVVQPNAGRGPDGLIAVGLDIGTGWVKVAALGRREMFPSLYSCTYAPGAGDADVLKSADEKGRPKAILRDAVGEAAATMASGRFATLIRPVKHGVPHDGRGYSRLAVEALRRVGIDDPGRAVICAGVPYDSRGDRDRIGRLLVAAAKPAYCMVLPQAYGTLKACGLTADTIVNIGHGTTEIMRVGQEGMYAVSIQKASEFVLGQLAQRQGRTGRDAYTDHEKVLADDPKMTAKLVELLAVHIADEVQQFGGGGGGGGGDGGAADAGIVLSGGGSRMPGMAAALAKALGGGIRVRAVDEPSYSNAIGLEMMAREMFGTAQKAAAAAKPSAAGPPAASGKGGDHGGPMKPAPNTPAVRGNPDTTLAGTSGR